ncbi:MULTISPECIES: FMN-dependent NADH-azoreductase [Alphaproteobacteria]|uniref:FMN dependent NADH:quinone oxidoreductase n=2 Tax=Alphaproteobacteria TaxID=28211 RepID=A0A512HHC8_9HYPH|nr:MULTISPECIES: FMN-dependent NADH-azoreductase [Alphaproteobacteria]GEO84848.1 FMN-dependent NADH-azoreductase [Ciceribacter naphthalenivorans]GLR22782.1 FMN-dependent NADH-azoreductase [Ciceribacter naphthalenivorans]GLT05638.1 FMN-dependent NADH-azoreductase [Sphingomonas psychrolutea]
MSSILLVTGSTRGDDSLSSKIARQLADDLAAKTTGASVVERDLSHAPLPHIGADFSAAIRLAPEDRTPAQAEAIAVSDAAVDELLAADTIVLSTGFINFGISSILKSWIDHVARAGRTFQYSENGPVGLATGKKAYLVIASGGIYSSGPGAALDFAEPYLRSVLAFLGVTDVETIRIEGIAYGPEAAEKAISEAGEKARELARAA